MRYLLLLIFIGFLLNACGSGSQRTNGVGGVHVGNPGTSSMAYGGMRSFDSQYGYSLKIPTDLRHQKDAERQAVAKMKSTNEDLALTIEVVEPGVGMKDETDFELEMQSLGQEGFELKTSDREVLVAEKKSDLKSDQLILTTNRQLLKVGIEASEPKGFDLLDRAVSRMSFDTSPPKVSKLELSWSPDKSSFEFGAEIAGEHSSSKVRIELSISRLAAIGSHSLPEVILTGNLMKKDDLFRAQIEWPADITEGDFYISQMMFIDYSGNRLSLLGTAGLAKYSAGKRSIRDESNRVKIYPTHLSLLEFSLP